MKKNFLRHLNVFLSTLFLFTSLLYKGVGGIKCHSCDEFGLDPTSQNPCLVNASATPIVAHRESPNYVYYCTAEIYYNRGKVYVFRGYDLIRKENATKSLSGCSYGPHDRGNNPEEETVQFCYCSESRCNTMKHKPPKKIDRPLRCLSCRFDDEGCEEADDKYLLNNTSVQRPTESVHSNINSEGTEEEFLIEPEPIFGIFKGSLNYYCTYTWSNTSGLLRREYEWKYDEPNLNGTCTSLVSGIETCYCNDRNGCNDRRGNDARTASAGVLSVLLVLVSRIAGNL